MTGSKTDTQTDTHTDTQTDTQTDTSSPCGAGPYQLLWAWYNGQPMISLPDNVSVFAGYDTDIHYLVARLVKFSTAPSPRLVLKEKEVRVVFMDCGTPQKYRHSNYRFTGGSTVDHTVDMSCKVNSSGVVVYGMYGEMRGGGEMELWRDKAAGDKAGGDKAAGDNVTQVKLGTLHTSNKLQLLPSPLRVRPGELLRARCTARDQAPVPRCRVTLLTMLPSDVTPAGGVPVCSTPANFTSTQSNTALLETVSLFLQDHVLVVLVVLVLVMLVLLVKCCVSGTPVKYGETDREFEGLLRDFDDLDHDDKKK